MNPIRELTSHWESGLCYKFELKRGFLDEWFMLQKKNLQQVNRVDLSLI